MVIKKIKNVFVLSVVGQCLLGPPSPSIMVTLEPMDALELCFLGSNDRDRKFDAHLKPVLFVCRCHLLPTLRPEPWLHDHRAQSLACSWLICPWNVGDTGGSELPVLHRGKFSMPVGLALCRKEDGLKQSRFHKEAPAR
jgi:hypothetical protein